MGNGRQFFEFRLPHIGDMKKEYPPPYRFTDAMRGAVDDVYMKHTHRWHKLYLAQHERGFVSDSNAMCQTLYSVVRYAMNNLNSLGGEMDNALDEAAVSMWKSFMLCNTTYKRENDFDGKYYPTDMSVRMIRAISGLMDKMLVVIAEEDYEVRGVWKQHVPKAISMAEDQLRYYERLCEDEVCGGEVAVENWVSG